jgi:hypothetical protein
VIDDTTVTSLGCDRLDATRIGIATRHGRLPHRPSASSLCGRRRWRMTRKPRRGAKRRGAKPCLTEPSEAAPGPLSAEQIQAISDAFDFLYSGLREAKRRFQASDDAGRDGAIHAVETVIKFLSLYEPVRSESLHAPLSVLFDALMSLGDGEVLPILRKVKRSGRVRASGGRDSLTGMIAFTVDGLCATGMSSDDARRSVARILQKAGVTPARGAGSNVTVRTIRGWCEEVAADVRREGEAAHAFDLTAQAFAAVRQTAHDPKAIRRALLDGLAHVARETRAGKNPVKRPA